MHNPADGKKVVVRNLETGAEVEVSRQRSFTSLVQAPKAGKGSSGPTSKLLTFP